jgi:hypothetical protein
MHRIQYRNNRVSLLWFGILCFVILSPSTQGSNGQAATAVPLSGITVDGDLSDWPDTLREYPISYPEDGDLPLSPEDLQATFRIAYNPDEQLLYVAVQVQDDSIVLKNREGDYCALFVPDEFRADDEQPVSFFLQFDDDTVTVSAMDNGYVVEQAAHHGPNDRQYEFSIKAEGLRIGRVLELDLAIQDRDADGSSTSFTWGKGSLRLKRKIDSDGRLGGVLLGDRETGRLSVQMKWTESGEPVRRAQVQVRKKEDDSNVLFINTDADGIFALDLPAGAYKIETAGESEATAVVTSGQTVSLTLDRPSPVGKTLATEFSVITRSRLGNRNGLWQSFSQFDNWGQSRISKLIQDRRGYVWVGRREEGVFRYDGNQFEKLNIPDDLNALTVFEDSADRLWIGTRDNGVWRFDSKQGALTQFSVKDGLSDNRVRDIIEDRRGNIWLATENGISRYDLKQFENFDARDGL